MERMLRSLISSALKARANPVVREAFDPADGRPATDADATGGAEMVMRPSEGQ